MRLITAIINFFRGLFGMVADKLEDPVRDGKFAIEDSKEQIAKFRTQIASLIAENKRMERKLVESEGKVSKWQAISESAASKNDWESAKTALERKSTSVNEVNTLKSEITKTTNIINNLKKQLETAQAKISSSESDLTRLAARNEAADIRQGLAAASSSLSSSDSPLAKLDKLKQKVDQKEAEAEALEEMAMDDQGDIDLEAKYSSGGSNVSDELEALKAKFSKPA